MSYQTILVHVDESRYVGARIRIAAAFAMGEHSHLVGAAMTGVPRSLLEGGEIDPQDPNLAAHVEFLRQRARTALAGFVDTVERIGVPSFEQRLVDDEAGGGISQQARYADLVVIGQPDPDEPSPAVMSDFPEYVVLHCGRPVLIIPYAGRFETTGERVLIAWDASKEATRAVSNAIPLLQRAQQVEVTVFNPASRSGAHGDQPGADIALYLARHNINVNVSQQQTNQDVGNALLSLATDLNVDLIVMGGYGHSRFREIFLGGATRTVLKTMTIPVLMSH